MNHVKAILHAAAPLGILLAAMPAMAAPAPAPSGASARAEAPRARIVGDLIGRTHSACAKDIRSDECGAYQRTLLVTVAALEGDTPAKGRDVTKLQLDALLTAVDRTAAPRR